MNVRYDRLTFLLVCSAVAGLPVTLQGAGQEEQQTATQITATFSIVAADPETGVCGTAVASKYPAVGKVVPYVRAGVGAFCTQHWHNPAWGEKALDMLQQGKLPEAVLAELLRDDPRRDKRQLAIIDVKGRAANRNPGDADPSGVYWGSMAGRYYACQGNTLTGREVIVAMARAYEETQGSLADRLMAALVAGDRAGGDHRGRLAAGIRVARPGVEGCWLDLQVEKSDNAVEELARKYAEASRALAVPAAKTTLHLAVPLPKRLTSKSDDAWHLVEIDKPDVKILAQMVPAIAADGTAVRRAGRLIADVPPRVGADGPRRFRLEPAKGAGAGSFHFEDVDERSLKLSDGRDPVLVYNHGLITCDKVPENDHRRSRACYIHPLWGLSGETLTDDFPRDHYHHHGVFWTWPHVGIDGKEYDLWAGPNIKDRFVRWICREVGPVAAVLAVENGWFVGDKKVMIERVWMRVHKVSENARSLDLEFTWIPTDRPVTLWGAGGKSYGGLTVRFAVADEKQSMITVPSGRAKDDLYETPLPWVDFAYPFDGAPAPSGAAIFVDPQHPDYPPTWLTRHYGAQCVGWPGVKPQTFAPGKPIRLGYRLWIHGSTVALDDLKRAYDGYTTASRVTWE